MVWGPMNLTLIFVDWDTFTLSLESDENEQKSYNNETIACLV